MSSDTEKFSSCYSSSNSSSDTDYSEVEYAINEEKVNIIKKEKLLRRKKKEKINKILEESFVRTRDEIIINNEFVKNKATLHYLDKRKNIKFLLTNIEPYLFNNELNEKHVNKLKKTINNETNLLNIFIFIYSAKNKKYYIFDGHHRIESLRDKPENEFLNEILVEIYHIDSFESNSTHKLFKSINNTKPFTEKIEDKVRDIFNSLENYFNNICKINKKKNKVFRDNKNRVEMPYVLKSKFVSRLMTVCKDYLKENNNDTEDIKVDGVVDKIIEINNELSKKKIFPLVNSVYSKNKEKRKKMNKKVKELNFYLGVFEINNYLTVEHLFE